MNESKKSADINWFKQRLTGAMFCIMAVFAILIARLFYLQVIEREEFSRLSENNCIRLQSIDPPRGMIFDRRGILLVENRPSFDLNIILKDAKPVNYNPYSEILSNLTRYESLTISINSQPSATRSVS